MSQEIRNLEPKALWNKFADLNAVPRPSKKEDRAADTLPLQLIVVSPR